VSERQAWCRNGLLLDEPGPPEWAQTHVALPWTETRAEGDHWLYYSGRNERGQARISRCRIKTAGDSISVASDSEPVLDVGPLGAFDDAGVTMSSIVRFGGRQLLYYTGWTLGRSVPFYFFAGAAISDDGGSTFTRASDAPILERSAVDPFLTASPMVLDDDGTLRMWYVSCVRWAIESGQPKHWYHVRYAESDDGIEWRRDGTVCVDFGDAGEYAIARPCVVKRDGRYRMWFSHRGEAYRLGYAESDDGVHWSRDDGAIELTGETHEFDTEMQCYPHIFSNDGTVFMLYNGNGYGASGVGYATRR
jgi:hypothetical protein